MSDLPPSQLYVAGGGVLAVLNDDRFTDRTQKIRDDWPELVEALNYLATALDIETDIRRRARGLPEWKAGDYES